jgi:fibro-slime domain-containing protein
MALPSRSRTLSLMMTTLLLAAVGCGSSGAGASGGGGASNGNGSGGGVGTTSVNGSGSTTTGGFEPIGSAGVGPDTGSGGAGACLPQLVGVLRDFKLFTHGGHPDFEHFGGDGLKGIVKNTLGPDRKPVYAHNGATQFTTGPNEFAQWYRDTPDVNIAFPFTVDLAVDAKGIGTYDNSKFFPLDDKGYGNEGMDHNYGFTYELHMYFMYNGGEVFSFTGDDDLWVFVNNKLAIDLGGLHPPQSAALDLDAQTTALGITKGQQYPLDFFQAERHSTGSTFKIQSSLDFTNCDPIIIPK